MKSILLFLSLTLSIQAQPALLSWNLSNLGSTKSDTTIQFIANQIKAYDIVALQEIVVNPSGAQAVAQLAEELNRTGNKWDYAVSEPTSSSAYKTERYAYLWQTAKVQLIGQPRLEKKYALEIDREPFYATFQYRDKQFTIVNFHAITKKRQPETEIKYFKFLPEEYPDLNLFFVGDFNCPETHSVFNPLKKMGYVPAFENQKTTLRSNCIEQDCLASPFDNMYYRTDKIKVLQQGIIPFYERFETLNDARKISDHVPIWVSFELL
ncbi:endonuclease/exonuclease/phosphatase family protein [Flavobacterium azooxidireducens]|uniref:Endonuclease/exonuclease/phosphatase family protein n=1 Tax=Flavobacterium azooxidireducens TaxID=1871076 RepID=A0ABY4KG56_9FLAO|nr:endonuclease/exonuclease/phosphatase family protein [Flavobacterium azooxidireducens]UPQ79786.1 endonuclease/exonuclease/phosphatase family protein [Flavobacterium azooxidireducens]